MMKGEAMNRFRTGFSLVEVLVGLAIAMISMVVIMQTFAVFEGGKRTVAGSADAQSNGAIALYLIEQDAKMAGWGMDSSVYAGCNNVYTYCDGSANCGGGTAGAIAGFSFAPLRITDGGSKPDSIATQFFSDPKLATVKLPGSTTLSNTMPQSSSELDVANIPSACENGNLMLAVQAGNCTLMQITQTQQQALKIQHNPGAGGIYNPPMSYQNENNWPAYTAGARLSCFKPADIGVLYQRTYSVDPATHQLQRTGSTAGSELIAPEIFDLQAQYGIAPSGSQTVNQWVDASGATWANPTLTDIWRIKAIRIALVARSSQYENPHSEECKATTKEMVDQWPSWAKFNTANYPSDWQCYRYKVFETVVPLRNVIWSNS